jgi:hypothetical protein
MNDKKNMSLKSSNVIIIPITMFSTVNIFDKAINQSINQSIESLCSILSHVWKAIRDQIVNFYEIFLGCMKGNW